MHGQELCVRLTNAVNPTSSTACDTVVLWECMSWWLIILADVQWLRGGGGGQPIAFDLFNFRSNLKGLGRGKGLRTLLQSVINQHHVSQLTNSSWMCEIWIIHGPFRGQFLKLDYESRLLLWLLRVCTFLFIYILVFSSGQQMHCFLILLILWQRVLSSTWISNR